MTPSGRASTDQSARERIRHSLDESLIVEASAGTGKTTELVNRIVAILASGRTTIDKIAAVTFTHKAAGELKLRLRGELDKARLRESPNAALHEALAHLEEASIGTVHSFCAQILRERPIEACVDPAFEELSEPEANRLYQRAFRAWLERRLGEPSPGLRRAFARLAWRDSWDDAPALEKLQYAARKLVEWRDYPGPWRSAPFAREEEIDTLVRFVRELAAAGSQPRRVTDNLYKGLAPARALADWIARSETAGARDYDSLEGRLLKLGRDLRRDSRKGSGEYGGGIAREALMAQRDELLRWLEEFRTRASADLAVLLRHEMSGVVEEYQERKHRLGKLDFVDLLIGVRDLVRDQAPVRQYLQRRFTHLFIDEFQDTDPLQAEILLLLAADDPGESNWLKATPIPGKLFLVGDPKQSIYKFRRADIVLYRQVRDMLSEGGVGVVTLSKSFRAVPNIQQFVNAAFAPEMDSDRTGSHAEWAPLEKFRGDLEGRPSVIVLPVPKPYGKAKIAVAPVKESLMDGIGAFIAWLVHESGWEIKPRDIAVLFRKRNHGKTDLTRETVRALEARGIPHLLAGSKSFHHREEVETLRIALTAIEWPDDELSVFATLKGSLFAIADETLLVWRHKHGSLHPFRKQEDEGSQEEEGSIAEALRILAELHRSRNSRPFAATVNDLLEATRAHAGFLMRPGGQQILANVMRVADLARTYETTGGISFRGFVEELNAQAEKEEGAEAPVLEEDSDGVRLMTVHSAKGLEFPVVILADIMTGLSRREPEQFVDGTLKLCAMELLGCAPSELAEHAGDEAARERAEGIRVAYVAATRARDLLVIPGVGDETYPTDGWLTPLHKAMYPSQVNWRKSQPAAGCPPFGPKSVLERPLDYDRQEEFSVRPGLIRPQEGSHEVVWWDPDVLELGLSGGQGLSQEKTLHEDGGGSLAAYEAWRTERRQLLVEASQPTLDIFLASEAKEPPPGDPIPVEFLSSSSGKTRAKSGRRFGALVHAVLRDAPLDATGDALTKLAGMHARLLGARDDEPEAAAEAVEAALAHPLLQRARTSIRCHREYPVLLKLDGNRMLEGIIDLAFLDAGRWVVVDFKTDADISEKREEYERQLRWYAYALSMLTGIEARAVLLGV